MSRPLRIILLHNSAAEDSGPELQDVLVQASAVAQALGGQGHAVTWLPCTLDLQVIADRMQADRPDLVFNLVESLGGTDRLMALPPLLLESLGLPFTGSGSRAVLATASKPAAKRVLREHGLPTPDWWEPPARSAAVGAEPPLAGSDRVIIKPVWEHASFGISDSAVVRWKPAVGSDGLRDRLAEAERRTGRPHFVEAFIEGREFNLSLLEDEQGRPDVLPPAEIDFSAFPAEKPRIVGYDAKWAADSFEYRQTPRRFDFPAADRPLLDELAALARTAWNLFGMRGFARVDFRVDAQRRPWILEVNANPCLSPDAGFAAAVEQAGLDYAAAVERIVRAAVGPRPPVDSESRKASRPLSLRWRSTVCDADVATVRRLAESTGVFRPDEVDIAVELVQERLQRGVASGYHFVFAEVDEEPVGYACYGPIGCTLGSYDLYWIVVAKERQGGGVGRGLIETVEQAVRSAGGRRLYIETSNRADYAPTREFYRRCGYCVEATLADFYSRGDDKVVLVKVLDRPQTFGT